MTDVDYRDLARRLIGLGVLGSHLEAADGHIWIMPFCIEDDDDWANAPQLAVILRAAGVRLNNKIYGGVLEALDTVDAALVLAGHPYSLRDIGDIGDIGDDWHPFFLGKPGVDETRIRRGDPGTGGIC